MVNTSVGTVREWHDDEGWGVIDCQSTPGGCWIHFSSVAVAGQRTLTAGQQVSLEWEAPGQDGFPYRATRAWPLGAEPAGEQPSTSTNAYRSSLTLSVED